MIFLNKYEHSTDPYGYYDQHGNRYLFLSNEEVQKFLRKSVLTFILTCRNIQR